MRRAWIDLDHSRFKGSLNASKRNLVGHNNGTCRTPSGGPGDHARHMINLPDAHRRAITRVGKTPTRMLGRGAMSTPCGCRLPLRRGMDRAENQDDRGEVQDQPLGDRESMKDWDAGRRLGPAGRRRLWVRIMYAPWLMIGPQGFAWAAFRRGAELS